MAAGQRPAFQAVEALACLGYGGGSFPVPSGGCMNALKRGLVLVTALLGATALGQPAAGKAKGQPEITWWGHAAFVIRTPGGATLAVDPWFKNPKAPQGATWPETVDAILVTHGHSDHVGDAAELAEKTGAQVISSFELTGLIGAKNSNGANIGGSIVVKDATIHLVEAVHSSGFGQDPQATRYGGPALGFVIQIANGPTLYHAGDTGFFSSMALIGERYKPTHALLPIGGHFTMDPAGAALAIRMLKVKNVIPMHYGTFPLLTGTPEQLTAALKTARVKAKVMVLEPGKAVVPR